MKDQLKVLAIWIPATLGSRPREDYHAFDVSTGSFVVADGVALYKDIEYTGNYPRVSGSYLIARTFCKAFVKYFMQHPQNKILSGFRAGNKAADKVNKGRSKYDVFEKHRNPFAATAAMARVRDGFLEWGQIYDAGVAVISKSGKVKFQKDNYSQDFLHLPRDIRNYEDNTYAFFSRTIARNAVGKDGRLLGYGVITGEPEAEKYLQTSKSKLAQGDIVALYTDGFTPYMRLTSFRKIISSTGSRKEFRAAIEGFTKAKSKVAGFQKEKSIIVIKI